MGYSKFQFGALYLDGHEQDIPKNPVNDGDITPYKSGQPLHIGVNSSPNCITWIKPDGMGTLIADRVLLSTMSWQDAERQHISSGKAFEIFGQTYLCRLLSKEEWHAALDITTGANALWHWKDMAFLTKSAWVKSDATPQHTFAGRMTPHFCGKISDSMKSVNVGFRPVLEVARFKRSKYKPNCVLDGEKFVMMQLPGQMHGFTPTLTPTTKPLFEQIPNGTEVRMYTLLYQGCPICPDPNNNGTFSKEEVEKLQLTDKYFGDEYLVPWIISNGMSIASKSLVYTK